MNGRLKIPRLSFRISGGESVHVDLWNFPLALPSPLDVGVLCRLGRTNKKQDNQCVINLLLERNETGETA